MKENSADTRMNDLESRLAFQDDTLVSLNQALVNQQQRIAHLEKSLAWVLDQIRQSEPDIELPAEEPPPPHY